MTAQAAIKFGTWSVADRDRDDLLPLRIVLPDRRTVAEVYADRLASDVDAMRRSRDERAHLIAAAPEMLAALHAALALIHEYEPESTSYGATQAAAAIAKAEGGVS